MFSTYFLFKFLHITGAMVWIGGVCTLTLLNARIARGQDWAATASLARYGRFLGSTLMGPSALVTLLAGLAMVVQAEYSFGTLWIVLGMGGIVAVMVLRSAVLGKLNRQAALATAQEPDTPRLAVLLRRMTVWNIVMVLVLLVVVGAMVFKPTW